MCGWVRAPTGSMARRAFHPARKLVIFSLLKCPATPNSKSRPRGEVQATDHLRLPQSGMISAVTTKYIKRLKL